MGSKINTSVGANGRNDTDITIPEDDLLLLDLNGEHSNAQSTSVNRYTKGVPTFLPGIGLTTSDSLVRSLGNFSQLSEYAKDLRGEQTTPGPEPMLMGGVPTEQTTQALAQAIWDSKVPDVFHTLLEEQPLEHNPEDKVLYSVALIRNLFLASLPPERNVVSFEHLQQLNSPQYFGSNHLQPPTFEELPYEAYFLVDPLAWLAVYEQRPNLQQAVAENAKATLAKLDQLAAQIDSLNKHYDQNLPREDILLIAFNQLVNGSTQGFDSQVQRLSALEASLEWQHLSEKQKTHGQTIQGIETELQRIHKRQTTLRKEAIGFQERQHMGWLVATDNWEWETQKRLLELDELEQQKQNWLTELELISEDVFSNQRAIHSAQANLMQAVQVSEDDWQAFLVGLSETSKTIPDHLVEDVDDARLNHAQTFADNSFARAYFQNDYTDALELAKESYQATNTNVETRFNQTSLLLVLQNLDTDPKMVIENLGGYRDGGADNAKLIHAVLETQKYKPGYQAVYIGGNPTLWKSWRFVRIDNQTEPNPQSTITIEQWEEDGRSVYAEKHNLTDVAKTFEDSTFHLQLALNKSPELQSLQNIGGEVLAQVLPIYDLFSNTAGENKGKAFVEDVWRRTEDLALWWFDNKDEALKVWEAAKPVLEALEDFEPSPFDTTGASQELYDQIQRYKMLGNWIEKNTESLCAAVLGRNYTQKETQNYAKESQQFQTDLGFNPWGDISEQPLTDFEDSIAFDSTATAKVLENQNAFVSQLLENAANNDPWVESVLQAASMPQDIDDQILADSDFGASRSASRRNLAVALLNPKNGYQAVYLSGPKTSWSSWAFVKQTSANVLTLKSYNAQGEVVRSETVSLKALTAEETQLYTNIEEYIEASEDLMNLQAVGSELFEKTNTLLKLFELAHENPDKASDYKLAIWSATADLKHFLATHGDDLKSTLTAAQDELNLLSNYQHSVLPTSSQSKRVSEKISYLNNVAALISSGRAQELCDEISGKQFSPSRAHDWEGYSNILDNWWNTEGVVIFGAVVLSVVALNPKLGLAVWITRAGTATRSFVLANGGRATTAYWLGMGSEVLATAALTSAFQVPGTELARSYSGANYHTGFESSLTQFIEDDIHAAKLLSTYAHEWKNSFVKSAMIMGAGRAIGAKAPGWSRSNNAHLRVVGESIEEVGGFADRMAAHLPVNETVRDILSEFGQEIGESGLAQYGDAFAFIQAMSSRVDVGIIQNQVSFNAEQKQIEIVYEYEAGQRQLEELEAMVNNPQNYADIENAGGLKSRTVDATPEGVITVTMTFASGVTQVQTYKPTNIPTVYRQFILNAQRDSEKPILLSELGVDYDPNFASGSLVLKKGASLENLTKRLTEMNLVISDVVVDEINPYVKAFIGEQQVMIFVGNAADLKTFQYAEQVLDFQQNLEKAAVSQNVVPQLVQSLLSDPDVQRRVRYHYQNNSECEIYLDPTTGLHYFLSSDSDSDTMEGAVLGAVDTVTSEGRGTAVYETGETSPYAAKPNPNWILVGEIHPRTKTKNGATVLATVEPSAHDIAGLLQETDTTERVILRQSDDSIDITWSHLQKESFAELSDNVVPLTNAQNDPFDADVNVNYSDENFLPEDDFDNKLARARWLARYAKGRLVAHASDDDGPSSLSRLSDAERRALLDSLAEAIDEDGEVTSEARAVATTSLITTAFTSSGLSLFDAEALHATVTANQDFQVAYDSNQSVSSTDKLAHEIYEAFVATVGENMLAPEEATQRDFAEAATLLLAAGNIDAIRQLLQNPLLNALIPFVPHLLRDAPTPLAAQFLQQVFENGLFCNEAEFQEGGQVQFTPAQETFLYVRAMETYIPVANIIHFWVVQGQTDLAERFVRAGFDTADHGGRSDSAQADLADAVARARGDIFQQAYARLQVEHPNIYDLPSDPTVNNHITPPHSETAQAVIDDVREGFWASAAARLTRARYGRVLNAATTNAAVRNCFSENSLQQLYEQSRRTNGNFQTNLNTFCATLDQYLAAPTPLLRTTLQNQAEDLNLYVNFTEGQAPRVVASGEAVVGELVTPGLRRTSEPDEQVTTYTQGYDGEFFDGTSALSTDVSPTPPAPPSDANPVAPDLFLENPRLAAILSLMQTGDYAAASTLAFFAGTSHETAGEAARSVLQDVLMSLVQVSSLEEVAELFVHAGRTRDIGDFLTNLFTGIEGGGLMAADEMRVLCQVVGAMPITYASPQLIGLAELLHDMLTDPDYRATGLTLLREVSYHGDSRSQQAIMAAYERIREIDWNGIAEVSVTGVLIPGEAPVTTALAVDSKLEARVRLQTQLLHGLAQDQEGIVETVNQYYPGNIGHTGNNYILMSPEEKLFRRITDILQALDQDPAHLHLRNLLLLYVAECLENPKYAERVLEILKPYQNDPTLLSEVSHKIEFVVANQDRGGITAALSRNIPLFNSISAINRAASRYEAQRAIYLETSDSSSQEVAERKMKAEEAILRKAFEDPATRRVAFFHMCRLGMDISDIDFTLIDLTKPIPEREVGKVSNVEPYPSKGYYFQFNSQLSRAQVEECLNKGVKHFGNANMSGLDLRGLNFENCFMNGAKLDGANMEEVSFKGARLVYASFKGVHAPYANFDEAALAGADFGPVAVRGLDVGLRGSLRPVYFMSDGYEYEVYKSSNLAGASFVKSIINDVDFNYASLRGVRFEESNWTYNLDLGAGTNANPPRHINFDHADFTSDQTRHLALKIRNGESGPNVFHPNVEGIPIIDRDYESGNVASFTDPNVTERAEITGCHWASLSLRHTNLSGVLVEDSNWHDVSVSHTNLEGTEFRSTTLGFVYYNRVVEDDEGHRPIQATNFIGAPIFTSSASNKITQVDPTWLIGFMAVHAGPYAAQAPTTLENFRLQSVSGDDANWPGMQEHLPPEAREAGFSVFDTIAIDLGSLGLDGSNFSGVDLSDARLPTAREGMVLVDATLPTAITGDGANGESLPRWSTPLKGTYISAENYREYYDANPQLVQGVRVLGPFSDDYPFEILGGADISQNTFTVSELLRIPTQGTTMVLEQALVYLEAGQPISGAILVVNSEGKAAVESFTDFTRIVRQKLRESPETSLIDLDGVDFRNIPDEAFEHSIISGVLNPALKTSQLSKYYLSRCYSSNGSKFTAYQIRQLITSRRSLEGLDMRHLSATELRDLITAASRFGEPVSLRGCDLRGVEFRNCDLSLVDFQGANLRNAKFYQCEGLSREQFKNANTLGAQSGFRANNGLADYRPFAFGNNPMALATGLDLRGYDLRNYRLMGSLEGTDLRGVQLPLIAHPYRDRYPENQQHQTLDLYGAIITPEEYMRYLQVQPRPAADDVGTGKLALGGVRVTGTWPDDYPMAILRGVDVRDLEIPQERFAELPLGETTLGRDLTAWALENQRNLTGVFLGVELDQLLSAEHASQYPNALTGADLTESTWSDEFAQRLGSPQTETTPTAPYYNLTNCRLSVEQIKNLIQNGRALEGLDMRHLTSPQLNYLFRWIVESGDTVTFRNCNFARMTLTDLFPESLPDIAQENPSPFPTHIIFEGSDFTEANFRHSDLRYMDFHNANLRYAGFTNCILPEREAFAGADTSNATVDGRAFPYQNSDDSDPDDGSSSPAGSSGNGAPPSPGNTTPPSGSALQPEASQDSTSFDPTNRDDLIAYAEGLASLGTVELEYLEEPQWQTPPQPDPTDTNVLGAGMYAGASATPLPPQQSSASEPTQKLSDDQSHFQGGSRRRISTEVLVEYLAFPDDEHSPRVTRKLSGPRLPIYQGLTRKQKLRIIEVAIDHARHNDPDFDITDVHYFIRLYLSDFQEDAVIARNEGDATLGHDHETLHDLIVEAFINNGLNPRPRIYESSTSFSAPNSDFRWNYRAENRDDTTEITEDYAREHIAHYFGPGITPENLAEAFRTPFGEGLATTIVFAENHEKRHDDTYEKTLKLTVRQHHPQSNQVMVQIDVNFEIHEDPEIGNIELAWQGETVLVRDADLNALMPVNPRVHLAISAHLQTLWYDCANIHGTTLRGSRDLIYCTLPMTESSIRQVQDNLDFLNDEYDLGISEDAIAAIRTPADAATILQYENLPVEMADFYDDTQVVFEDQNFTEDDILFMAQNPGVRALLDVEGGITVTWDEDFRAANPEGPFYLERDDASDFGLSATPLIARQTPPLLEDHALTTLDELIPASGETTPLRVFQAIPRLAELEGPVKATYLRRLVDYLHVIEDDHDLFNNFDAILAEEPEYEVYSSGSRKDSPIGHSLILCVGELAAVAPEMVTEQDVELLVGVLRGGPMLTERDFSPEDVPRQPIPVYLTAYHNIAYALEEISHYRLDLATGIVTQLQEIGREKSLRPEARMAMAQYLASLVRMYPQTYTKTICSEIQTLLASGIPHLMATGFLTLRKLVQMQPNALTLNQILELGTLIEDENATVLQDLLCETSIEDETMNLRSLFLADVLQPASLAQPTAITVEFLDEVYRNFKHDPAIYFYFMFVTNDSAVVPRARNHAQALGTKVAENLGYTDFQNQVYDILAQGPQEVIIVHSSTGGYGDRLIEVGHFMQALLAFNPELNITIITNHASAYKHPRVRTINKDQEAQVETVLDDREYSAYFRLLDGDLAHEIGTGLSIARNPHLYEMPTLAYPSVRIDNQSFSGRRFGHHIPQVLLNNGTFRDSAIDGEFEALNDSYRVHESSLRVLAALGIPYDVRNPIQNEETILTTQTNEEAEGYWQEYIARNNTENRPIAVYNPIGHQHTRKGLSPENEVPLSRLNASQIAEQVQALEDLGYFVVIAPSAWLPTGNKDWGTAEHLYSEVARLNPDYHVVIHEIAMLPSNGFFNNLVLESAIVVTAEGGLGHSSALLGRPVYILEAQGMAYDRWFPYGVTSVSGFDLRDEIPNASIWPTPNNPQPLSKNDINLEGHPDYDVPVYSADAGVEEAVNQITELLQTQDVVVVAFNAAGNDVGKTTLSGDICIQLQHMGIPADSISSTREFQNNYRIQQLQRQFGSNKKVIIYETFTDGISAPTQEERNHLRTGLERMAIRAMDASDLLEDGFDLTIALTRPDRPLAHPYVVGDFMILNEKAEDK